MSTEVFDGQLLAEKLSKLNNSQQSIESLSRWCVSHRKKAKQMVETWEKLFNSSSRDQRVSFLYLANDILQNSRRKGSEFVNEFWKVLPTALKNVYESGDEQGKKAVTRLVGIWEERKVFGSRGQSLKDEMLGKNPPPISVANARNLNPIKIVKKDAQSIRIKLAVGALPEKIISAFQSVLEEYSNEEAALNKCSTALHHVGKVGEDVENMLAQGNHQGSISCLDELQKEENVLNECIGQLESAEATRVSLITQLKEALQEQESKLEHILTQMQVARHQIEQASTIRKRLTMSSVSPTLTNTGNSAAEAMRVIEQILHPVHPTSSQPQSLIQPAISFAPLKTTDEDNKKAAAAAVAAKLAASTSSAQMLTSVLSSLVAEEAASMNDSSKSGFPMFSSDKRQKLEKPISASEVSNSDAGNATYFNLQQQPVTSVPITPSPSMQPMSQSNTLQSPFASLPPPPPPSQPPTTPPSNRYGQSTGLMVGAIPYGYGSNTLPPPPPLPPHVAMGLTRPTPKHQAQPQPPQQQQQPPMQPATGGFYRPPGIGFYGQNNQATTPPVPRQ